MQNHSLRFLSNLSPIPPFCAPAASSLQVRAWRRERDPEAKAREAELDVVQAQLLARRARDKAAVAQREILAAALGDAAAAGGTAAGFVPHLQLARTAPGQPPVEVTPSPGASLGEEEDWQEGEEEGASAAAASGSDGPAFITHGQEVDASGDMASAQPAMARGFQAEDVRMHIAPALGLPGQAVAATENAQQQQQALAAPLVILPAVAETVAHVASDADAELPEEESGLLAAVGIEEDGEDSGEQSADGAHPNTTNRRFIKVTGLMCSASMSTWGAHQCMP